jgi:hypothetical protein
MTSTSPQAEVPTQEEQAFLQELDWLAASRLPVLACLQPARQQALALHVISGNTGHRQKQVLEFFKTVDWLALEELDFRPFKALSPLALQGLKRDLRAYYLEKEEKKQENQGKQSDYKNRVDAYFKQQVPANDKALLESLRDYELALTGRDVNWQHHFRLKSFKRVDAFVEGTHAFRLAWIAEFRHDVLTYKRNLEAITQAGQYPYTMPTLMDFDTWCDLQGEAVQVGASATQEQRQRRSTDFASPVWPAGVLLAFGELGLSVSTPWEAIKKRFRQLTLKHHPDLPHGCEQTMKRLLSAYQVLEKHLKKAYS